MVGETVERYRVEGVLGEGGAAAVYRVVHGSLGSTHALKVLRITSEGARERLLREGRTQSRVHHPNLVAVTDILAADDRPALVLEYVDGPSLDRWLHDHGRPTLVEALALFHGIVRGVEAAHAAGLVHRDLKPQNVLLAVTADGLVPKISDFGLVRDLTGQEPDPIVGLGGTPGYMAPEVLRAAEDVDERADLFGLGCLLYELVTGRRAFEGGDLVAAASRTLEARYTPPEELAPDLPPSVARVIRRLLEPDRDRRLRSCAELLHELYGERGPAGQETLSFEAIPVVAARVPTTPARAAIHRVRFSSARAVVALLVGLLTTTGAGVGGLVLGARGLAPATVAPTLAPGVATRARLDPPPLLDRSPAAAQAPMASADAPAADPAGPADPADPARRADPGAEDPADAARAEPAVPAPVDPADPTADPADAAADLTDPAAVDPADPTVDPADAGADPAGSGTEHPADPQPRGSGAAADRTLTGAAPDLGIEGAVPSFPVAPVGADPLPEPLSEPTAPVSRVTVPTGRVLVEGDGTVQLTSPDGLVAAPGSVLAGIWHWQARFGTASGPAGTLQVDPGQTIVLKCSSFAMRCLTLTR